MFVQGHVAGGEVAGSILSRTKKERIYPFSLQTSFDFVNY